MNFDLAKIKKKYYNVNFFFQKKDSRARKSRFLIFFNNILIPKANFITFDRQ